MAGSANDLSIPFVTLPNWAKAAARCGFKIEPIFRELGIETDLIHLQDMSVTPRTLERVMEACVARSRRHHFPFVLGETFAFEYLPDLETFVMTSPTLREAARVFDWVRTLVNPMIQVRVEERGPRGLLVLDTIAGGGRTRGAYFVEATFASILRFGRSLVGGAGGFEKLTFSFPAPSYAKAAGRYFGLPVEFRRRQNALVFDRKLLDLPLAGAYPALHRQAEYLVERRVARLPRRPALAAEIESLLEQHPELLGRGIGRVAARLGVGARTLQRRLQDEGQGFAGLMEQVRYRAAVRQLEGASGDLDAISERLGFSDRRSFTRAFRRWSGLTPSAFRARTGAAALSRTVPSRRRRS